MAYHTIIIWSNNKTSEWLNDMPSLKKCEILEDARRSAPQMMEAFREAKGPLPENTYTSKHKTG